MIIIPAIDLKDGKVVRYTKGKFNKKVYSSDPVAVALEWQRQGAEFLHIVDLDGALYSRQKNLPIIKKIIRALDIPVEVGGGIRDLKTIKRILDMGARRVVLGTRALEDIDFLRKAIAMFKVRVAVGIDTSGGKIGLRGWQKFSGLKVRPLLKTLKALRLKTLIYTDIQRDGTLKGVNITGVKSMLRATDINLVVSGGICSLEDIKKLNQLKYPNLQGLIIGKALYEQRFTLREAIAMVNTFS